MNLIKANEVAKEHRKQYITLDNGEKIKWDDNTDVKVWIDDNGVPINQQQYDELKRQAAENQWNSTADANSLINQEVKLRAADREADARTPGIGTIMTQPLQIMAPAAPSNLFGTAMGIYRGDNFNTVVNKLFGENNTGFLEATEGTKKWAKEHPWSAMAINLAGDIAAPVAVVKAPQAVKAANNAAKMYRLSSEMDKAAAAADVAKTPVNTHKVSNMLDEMVAGADLKSTPSKVRPARQLIATGNTKEINTGVVKSINLLANATKDPQLLELAAKVNQYKSQGRRLPEELIQYMRVITKNARKTQAPVMERIKLEEPQLVAPERVVNDRYTVPGFPKKKYTTSQQTGDFKDAIVFKDDLVDADQFGEKARRALKSIEDFENGKFEYTPEMMDEIVSKTRSVPATYADNQANTAELRRLFSNIEIPKIINRQLQGNVARGLPAEIEEEVLGNVGWLKEVQDRLLKHYYNNPFDYGKKNVYAPWKIPGDAIVIGERMPKLKATPDVVKLKRRTQQLFPTNEEGIVLPKRKVWEMTERPKLFTRGTYITLDEPLRKPQKVYVPFDQHHNNELAMMEAEAYLKNPNPESPVQHVLDYQKNKSVDHYDNFAPLRLQWHRQAHDLSKYSKQDIARIKYLSRTGRFENMDDLLEYYDRMMLHQHEVLAHKRGGTVKPASKLIKK